MEDLDKISEEIENYNILLLQLANKTFQEDKRLPDSEWSKLDVLEKKIRQMCKDASIKH